MIYFKEEKLKSEFETISPRLKNLLFAMAGFMKYYDRRVITITSLIRLGDARSLHYYGRAADVSIKGLTDDIIKSIKFWFDYSMPYGNNKPTIYPHGEGDNFHLHCQVNF